MSFLHIPIYHSPLKLSEELLTQRASRIFPNHSKALLSTKTELTILLHQSLHWKDYSSTQTNWPWCPLKNHKQPPPNILKTKLTKITGFRKRIDVNWRVYWIWLMETIVQFSSWRIQASNKIRISQSRKLDNRNGENGDENTKTRWDTWIRDYHRRWWTQRHWERLSLWRRRRFEGLWFSQQFLWRLREASATKPWSQSVWDWLIDEFRWKKLEIGNWKRNLESPTEAWLWSTTEIGLQWGKGPKFGLQWTM